MPDQLDDLVVSVRADTQAFAADIERMRSTFDGGLLTGFERAGQILERSLMTAIRKGSFGFEDLKRVALSVLDQIANRALKVGLDAILGGGNTGSGDSGGNPSAGVLGGLLTSLLGLPGRETGGIVAPGKPYLVGERGPEVFVPTSAGRIDTGRGAGPGRDVRVAINLSAPRGTDAPAALQRSSRQVAAAVRRALAS